MAVDTTDLKTIFQVFLTDSKTALLEVQTQTQMEDEYFAAAVAQIISNSMTNSIQALDVINGITIKSAQSAKDLLVKDAQIAESAAGVIVKNAQSAKDLLVKDAQIAESAAGVIVKNAQSAKDLLVKDAQIAESAAGVIVKNAQSAKDLLVKSAQEALLIEQKNNEVQRVLLTTRQTGALDDARRVKKAQILGETIAMIQSGGITPPAEMQTDFNLAIDAV